MAHLSSHGSAALHLCDWLGRLAGSCPGPLVQRACLRALADGSLCVQEGDFSIRYFASVGTPALEFCSTRFCVGDGLVGAGPGVNRVECRQGSSPGASGGKRRLSGGGLLSILEQHSNRSQGERPAKRRIERPREDGGVANGWAGRQAREVLSRFQRPRQGPGPFRQEVEQANGERNGFQKTVNGRLPRNGDTINGKESSSGRSEIGISNSNGAIALNPFTAWHLQPNKESLPKDYDNRWARRMQNKLGVDIGPPMVSMPAVGMMVQHTSQQKGSQKIHDEPKEVVLPGDVTVRRLAQGIGVSTEKIEEVLGSIGEEMQSIEDRVPMDAAELAAAEFGWAVSWAQSITGSGTKAEPRPAVVTVMGHVDHGKTTLLDSLRRTSVAASEAGGITQHIGAFEVKMPGSKRSLTFLDTPGHAAFKAMRARGAKVTDLVVLVVAADDGVMPQTKEAYSQARECGCPLVVAISKCDLPQANVEKAKQQLVAAEVELEEYGGNVQVVQISAKTGAGLLELEEALILQADVLELSALRDGTAEAVVVEAHLDKGLGPVATIIVKGGTLHVGDSVVVGTLWGKIRTMKDSTGTPINSVLPGQPAEICGLRGVPQAGDALLAVCNEDRAKRVSDARAARKMAPMLQVPHMNGVLSGCGETHFVDGRALNIVLKADAKGTGEAARDAILQLGSDVVGVQVMHVGVGPVTETDIVFAATTNSRIFAFNVRTTTAEEAFAKQQNVDIHEHSIIYHMLDHVGQLLIDIAPACHDEVVHGEAEVLQVFSLKGKRGNTGEMVAGCKVLEGQMQRHASCFKVVRSGKVVSSTACSSLRRHKLSVERVGKGAEFGAVLEGFTDFKQGDVIQCIVTEKRKPKTESVLGGGLRVIEAPSAPESESTREAAA
ncbi:unnamed protein product [Ostreobium quekettii]|uniref:Translation initiation factor IF-2, chloroplastic n=1 Tax=Ostreobium quekettii TaxID=121088 RepID=A0A8S1J226_9CHLO|nr:unnamed protein product [Ostreobium quekettii]|eukprot:evm.model.scf_27.4 EVM.evm.TU.scf_27.4   scf_27:25651-36209(+)